MTYDELLEKAEAKGLTVKEKSLQYNNGRIKGDRIAIRQSMATNEKACVLAEELGHYETSVGNIIDMSNPQNRKQERQARFWAYNKQIGLCGLIQAYEHGCSAKHEIAEYLNVTEEFLQDAVDCYSDKYGIMREMDNYVIYFVPNLAIMKLI